MLRPLFPLSLAAVALAGCCCDSPPARRFVPTSSVVRVEPQPATWHEFQEAEQQGCLVAATGRGVAFGVGDQPVRLQAGEALHVLRVNSQTGEVLVCRLDAHELARLSPDALEVRATTYRH